MVRASGPPFRVCSRSHDEHTGLAARARQARERQTRSDRRPGGDLRDPSHRPDRALRRGGQRRHLPSRRPFLPAACVPRRAGGDRPARRYRSCLQEGGRRVRLRGEEGRPRGMRVPPFPHRTAGAHPRAGRADCACRGGRRGRAGRLLLALPPPARHRHPAAVHHSGRDLPPGLDLGSRAGAHGGVPSAQHDRDRGGIPRTQPAALGPACRDERALPRHPPGPRHRADVRRRAAGSAGDRAHLPRIPDPHHVRAPRCLSLLLHAGADLRGQHGDCRRALRAAPALRPHGFPIRVFHPPDRPGVFPYAPHARNLLSFAHGGGQRGGADRRVPGDADRSGGGAHRGATARASRGARPRGPRPP